MTLSELVVHFQKYFPNYNLVTIEITPQKPGDSQDLPILNFKAVLKKS